MDLLAITDIHGRTDRYESMLEQGPEPDVVVLGGDLTHFGTPDQAESIVESAREHANTVLAVAGNCDSAEIDRRLTDLGVSVHSEGKTVHGVGIFGVSAMPPWHGNMYAFSEADIDTYLQAGYSQVEHLDEHVIVSHTPPKNAEVDRVSSGEAVGSTSVRKWVDDLQPRLVISGHVHEARGSSTIGPTRVVNCGPARDGFYARIDLDPDGETMIDLREM